MSLRLGVIGLSEGNGHPYSWSAIYNGYDKHAMESCGFPVIPRYLEKESWPAAAIDDAQVTHVWTQDNQVSQHLSQACRIEHVVTDMLSMIGEVDGILLARDDPENHLELALPFIKAGLPIYIDKPICLSKIELDELFEAELYSGQIYSCSALRYAKELKLSDEQKQRLGRINHINAIVPKDWQRYAIHIIEPLLLLVGTQKITQSSVVYSNASTTVSYQWESGVSASVTATGNASGYIGMDVFGEKDFIPLRFSDTFNAFKTALVNFTESVKSRTPVIEKAFYYEVVEMLAIGCQK